MIDPHAIGIFHCPIHGAFEDLLTAAPGWCPACDARVPIPTTGRTACGGCLGSGRIVNPNSGVIERHEVCGGEGVRR